MIFTAIITFIIGLVAGAKLENNYWANRRRRQRRLEQEAKLRQMDSERFEPETISEIKIAA